MGRGCSGAGFGTVLRSLRTPFLDEWNSKLGEPREQSDRLQTEMAAAVAAGRRSEFLLTAGQAAGDIDDVLPVAEIVRRLVAAAEETLHSANRLLA
jgi:NAD(P)H-dependent flavin oxidoreductase YrpB (nitropropane dioxygenase family)